MLRDKIIKHRWLLAILILAAILRSAAIFWLPQVDLTGGDFALYDRMAKNLIVQGNFGGEPEATLGTPNINPGQALWLAFLYDFFGDGRAVVMAGQIALGLLLVYAAYLLARELFAEKGEKASLLAAFFTAVFLPLIIITVEPYNTLLYSVLISFFLLFIFKSTKNPYFAVPAGLFMGLAILNESIAFYIPVVVGIWIFSLRLGYKRALIIFLSFLFSAGAVLAPWAARNMAVAKGEVRIISKGEIQLVSPEKVSSYSKRLMNAGFIARGMKNMFFLPYGLWRLDQGSLSYSSLPAKIFNGERFPPSVLINFALKTFSALFHWVILVLAILAAFKYRIFGSLMLFLLMYTFAAGLAYVAYQNGDFSKASHLSSFVLPFFALFAAFAAGLFMVKMSSKNPT